jgi:hypothetical protein
VGFAETNMSTSEIEMMKQLKSEWAMLELFPAVKERSGQQKAMLLIFWDEARTLVERKVGDDPIEPRLVNLFIIVGRVIRKIGRANGYPTTFPIFHIFTDTTSRIGPNFQPPGATDASQVRSRSRRPDESSEDAEMFPTLYLLPTIDLKAAEYFATSNVTTQTALVQNPNRLLKFGRAAWSLYTDDGNKDYTLLFAREKLFSCQIDNLGLHFDPKWPVKSRGKSQDKDKLRFLACLCSRLAIQTGSCVMATSERVASHMMVLERVGDDNYSLESHYISEPVLVEVAAEAMGQYGWDLVLRTLVSEM